MLAKLRTEFLLRVRNGSELIGLGIVMCTFTVVLCLLIRKLLLSPEEFSLICTPSLWLIFIITVMRMMMQQTEEEVEKGIFFFHKKLGHSSSELFYTKWIVASLYASLLLFFELFVFFLLMGTLELVPYILIVALVFLFALPGVVALSFVGALMSVRVKHKELLMPIVVFPLLIVLSLAAVSHIETVVSYSETGIGVSDKSFWLWIVLGMSLVSVMCSELASRGLFSLED